MKTHKISEIASANFPPCQECFGGQSWHECLTCKGCGHEPVLVENPLKDCGSCLDGYWECDEEGTMYAYPIKCRDCKGTKKIPFRKLQVGVPFEVNCDVDYGFCSLCNGKGIIKYLPIRPIKEGDLSKVWVVKIQRGQNG